MTYRYKTSYFPWGLANLKFSLFWWFRTTSEDSPRSWVTNSLRLTTGSPFCPGSAQVREIPPTSLRAGQCLQVHSPLLLQRTDPSSLWEYWLPWVGLYLGLTSQQLPQQLPGVPGASCHPLSESGTQESSSTATCTHSGIGQVTQQKTDFSITGGLQNMH